MKHAKLSASSSHRWMACAGSVNAESKLPNTSSRFADEGSCAHEVAEKALNEDAHPSYYIGQQFHNTIVTDEMTDYVQEYIDYIDALRGSFSTVLVEQRVDFSKWVDEGFGTADAIIINEGHVHVVDLKYGKGVPVYADNNSQGMLYALGTYNQLSDHHPIKHVTIHIVQPRIPNFSEWTISVKDLLYWATTTLANSAKLCLDPNAPRIPSEKACQFCRAKGSCGELYQFTNDLITDMFDTENSEMTQDQTSKILDNKKLIEGFLKAVEARATSELELGNQVKGYKLVAGRSVRKWDATAEESLIEELGDKAYNKKLIGLGDATKLLSKEFVTEHTIRPEPKPVIAKESDVRPALDHVGFDVI